MSRAAYGIAMMIALAPGTGRPAGFAVPAPVADIAQGAEAGSDPGSFLTVGAKTFFVARTAVSGWELWVTDGTPEGTRLVRDVAPGRDDSIPDELTAVGDLLFFAAQDREAGTELWRSDGTQEGTWRVADIDPGIGSSQPRDLVDAGGVLYFAADSGALGRELWRSDGTAEGTWRVRDIAEGAADSDPTDLCIADDLLLFAATDSASDRELWASDGTEEGTQRLLDLRLGPMSSSPTQLAGLGGSIILQATADDGRRVWRVDPATAGVEALTPPVGLFQEPFFPVGDLLYFDTLAGLHRTDGTSAGTWPVRAKYEDVDEVADVGGWALFPGDLSFGANRELWRSDGTVEGTEQVLDLRPGGSSDPYDLLPLGDELLFFATPAPGVVSLYRSDRTEMGTVLLDSFGPGSFGTRGLTEAVGSIVFAGAGDASGRELWSTQGTPGSTKLLADLNQGTVDSEPGPFAWFEGRAWFSAHEGDGWWDLWRSDGTEEGTVPVEGVDPGRRLVAAALLGAELLLFLGEEPAELWKLVAGAESPILIEQLGTSLLEPAAGPLPVWDGAVWFLTSRSWVPSTHALWRSDGSSEGTFPVYEGNGSLERPAHLAVAGGRLFFRPRDGELWASDGTEEGTARVKDIFSGEIEANVSDLVSLEDRVLFSARTNSEGWELWISDGTEEGTKPVADIVSGSGSSNPDDLVALDHGVVFVADDGESGMEPWWSDGTEEGTKRLRDIAPGAAHSFPSQILRLGSHVFFTAHDADHGRELWKTDGTEAGTVRVRDLVPGPESSFVRELTVAGSLLVFTACDDLGCEPWTSNGTEEGTRRLADLVPGQVGSDPALFASDGVRLVFAASSEEAGREVWWAPEPRASACACIAIAALAVASRLRRRSGSDLR